MQTQGISLTSLVEFTKNLPQVRKADVCAGDIIFVKSRNSVYTISVLGNGKYTVSGGWFEKKYHSPMNISINGCSWGGSAIKIDVVAACGLCIEFGNRVRTSMIEKIFVLKKRLQN